MALQKKKSFVQKWLCKLHYFLVSMHQTFRCPYVSYVLLAYCRNAFKHLQNSFGIMPNIVTNPCKTTLASFFYMSWDGSLAKNTNFHTLSMHSIQIICMPYFSSSCFSFISLFKSIKLWKFLHFFFLKICPALLLVSPFLLDLLALYHRGVCHFLLDTC